MSFNGKSVDSFLSIEECSSLVEFAKGIQSWEENKDVQFWNNRTLRDTTIYNKYSKNVGLKIKEITKNTAEVIKKLYNLTEVYPDHVSLSRWFPGMWQPPHADDNPETPEGEYGTIIYLNNEYGGGHTYYENYDIEITPQVGSLVIHPGNEDHLHGVTKIESGIRYTLSSFWTTNKDYAHEWSI